MFDRFFRKAQRPSDDEIARELRDHLELETSDLAAAGAGDDARFAARRNFGNESLALEATRDAWDPPRWRRALRDLSSDVAYALRRLKHAPGFAALIVLTVGIGVGATTAIFSVVNAVVLRPIPIADPDRVVRIYETNPKND